MIKFFRKNYQVFSIFIFFYCIISVFSIHYIQSSKFYTPGPINLPFLFQYQNVLFQSDIAPFIFSVLTVGLLILCGFLLVRLSIRFLIIRLRSQFQSLFFIAISSFAFFQELFSGALIGVFFLLIALNRIFSAAEDKGYSLNYLDAGLLLGIGSLFYFNLIFFFPFIWFSQAILRQFNWREFIFSIFGIAIPFLYVFSAYFIIDKSVSGYISFIKEWLFLNKVIDMSWQYYAGIIYYIFVMIIASIFALKKFSTTKIQSRKLYQLFLYLFINGILIVFLMPSAGAEMFYILAVPASILLSIYFTECRTTFINNVFFFLLITAPIVLNIIRLRF